jgi:hypothetical protein
MDTQSLKKKRQLSDSVLADSYFACQNISCFMFGAKSMFFFWGT